MYICCAGALYLEDISDLRSERGSLFFNNSASGGGAMAFQGVKIKAEISNVEFINNRATGSTDGVCTAGTESLCAGGGAVLVLDITDIAHDMYTGQGITMNFAVCLNGANDLTFQGDQFEAFLQLSLIHI